MSRTSHTPLAAAALALALSAPAFAAPLRVATWNLGWHMDRQMAATWAQACGQPFALSASDQKWRPAPGGDRSGWELRWGRDAPIDWDIGKLPPCDVYQAGGRIVPVVAEAYAVRQRQIREILARDVAADVLALQEVSGRQAVAEVLPDEGRDHDICAYEGHKVQRLAIAWRRSLGERVSCEVHWPLSLPALAAKDQPRPGLALTLRVGGKLLRFLTLHLKSSCVSPLDKRATQGRGQLDGTEPNCLALQQQIAPLEAWIEQQSVGVDALIVLGDFNRNLQHEDREPRDAPVRSAGSPTDPHRPGQATRNLWREVNDGVPASSRLKLLAATCPGDASVRALCDRAQQDSLERPELQQLGDAAALGCRNPVGLDHIAVSPDIRASNVSRVALGVRGRTLAAKDGRPALLGVSDHCPLVADLER